MQGILAEAEEVQISPSRSPSLPMSCETLMIKELLTLEGEIGARKDVGDGPGWSRWPWGGASRGRAERSGCRARHGGGGRGPGVGGYTMIVLDISIVITALTKIHYSLGFSSAALSWVQNAYLLAFGGLLLLGALVFARRASGRRCPMGQSALADARVSAGEARFGCDRSFGKRRGGHLGEPGRRDAAPPELGQHAGQARVCLCGGDRGAEMRAGEEL
jgi:hypothetical protein